MKKNILFLTSIILLFLCESSQAQTTSIMDAEVNWNDNGGIYTGTLIVYMTDSTNVSGVHIMIGSQPSDSDLYNITYTGAVNGNFGSSGNVGIQNNNLSVNLGTFSYHGNYYLDIKVLVSGSANKEIEIHSTN